MLTQGDLGYEPDNDEFNLAFDFHHERIDPMVFQLPLFWVNHEAHAICQLWIRQQGLKACISQGSLSTTFIRPFNPVSDMLYVSLDRWTDFLCEPSDRAFEPDLVGRNLTCSELAVKNIAVHAELLRSHGDEISGMLYEYYGLTKMFIILNLAPDLQPASNDTRLQQRWELENVQAAPPVWNCEEKDFEWGESGNPRDSSLYNMLKGVSNEVGTDPISELNKSLHVQFVVALKK